MIEYISLSDNHYRWLLGAIWRNGQQLGPWLTDKKGNRLPEVRWL